MLVFFLVVTFLIHTSACLFYYMASLKGFSDDTWVHEAGIEGSSLGIKYVAAIYWATTTICTVRPCCSIEPFHSCVLL